MIQRRLILLLVAIPTLVLTYLIRDLTVVVIGLLLLAYYELVLQRRLMQANMRQAAEAEPESTPVPDDKDEPSIDDEVDMEEENPAEELVEEGPGFYLTEPEYIVLPDADEEE